MRLISCAPAVRGLPVRGALLAAAALLLTTPAATAQAAPEPYQGNWVYVSVTAADARSGVPAEAARGTLLLCDPPQAVGHREAVRACAELADARGDLKAIPARSDAVCPMRYAPVTARARGEWGGRLVQYTETFPNECVMTARTGDVFTLADTAPAEVPGPE